MAMQSKGAKSHVASPLNNFKKWTGHFNNASIPGIFNQLNSLGRVAKIILVVFLSLCIIGIFCYPSAKTCYHQARKTEKLQAEQTAVLARNEQVQKNVDALNTEEGIEATAHAELGYVKSGEGTAIVQGVETESSSKLVQYVDPNSITAPNQWYNGILDIVFFYDNSPKTSN
jgi:cell division protein FtsB